MGRILPGVRANTGVCSNDELLRALIAEHTGCSPALVDRRLRWLSGRAFPLLWWCFRPQRGARELVAHLAGRGVRQVLATNPLWPRQTVLSRADWGGIDVAHFDYITAGENMTRSKPRTEYYRELLDKLGVQPHECLMIGNDARNDAPASRLGIAVYLIGSGSSGLSDGAVRGAEPVLLTTGSWSALPAWLGV
jgi:FMN phosphatase YigB (HAD superfamily)